MIEQPQLKLPVIKCLPRAIIHDYRDGMKFWCPYCKKWHLHGRGNGSRVAHCVSESPFFEHGYVIKMMSKAELREIKKEIDAYLESNKP